MIQEKPMYNIYLCQNPKCGRPLSTNWRDTIKGYNNEHKLASWFCSWGCLVEAHKIPTPEEIEAKEKELLELKLKHQLKLVSRIERERDRILATKIDSAVLATHVIYESMRGTRTRWLNRNALNILLSSIIACLFFTLFLGSLGPNTFEGDWVYFLSFFMIPLYVAALQRELMERSWRDW